MPQAKDITATGAGTDRDGQFWSPIIMSGPMVLALNAGLKTQTRRLAKLPHNARGPWRPTTVRPTARDRQHVEIVSFVDAKGTTFVRCQYGAAGDRLWVKETLIRVGRDGAKYAADGVACPWIERWPWKSDTLSPIFMPWAARRHELTLTNVRAQRLHNIDEVDAQAEGVERDDSPCDHTRLSCEEIGCMGQTYRSGFVDAWHRLHGDESWDANPHIFALTFTATSRLDVRA